MRRAEDEKGNWKGEIMNTRDKIEDLLEQIRRQTRKELWSELRIDFYDGDGKVWVYLDTGDDDQEKEKGESLVKIVKSQIDMNDGSCPKDITNLERLRRQFLQLAGYTAKRIEELKAIDDRNLNGVKAPQSPREPKV